MNECLLSVGDSPKYSTCIITFNLFINNEAGPVTVSISQMTPRTEATWLAQGHTAGRRRRQDLNTGHLCTQHKNQSPTSYFPMNSKNINRFEKKKVLGY